MQLSRDIHKHHIGLYTITCLSSGKVYVGSSINLRKRLLEHIRLLNLNKHHCRHLQHSFTFYGPESCRIDIVRYCRKEELESGEKSLIDDVYLAGILLNSTRDYRGSFGLVKSQETKNKISIANKGRTAHNKGVPMSAKQREQQIATQTKACGKKVDIYTKSGDFVETHESINAAIRKYNLDKRSTQRCLSGSSKNSQVHGLVFRYHGEPFARPCPSLEQSSECIG